tara:strand:- start:888 stop:1307 length:420 start_codon:yes stop_codon:yes gene_type:complete
MKDIVLKKDCALTRLLIQRIEESDRLLETLRSWEEVDYLDLIPSYQDNRDLRNEKSRAVLDKEQYNLTINSLRDEIATFRQALNLPLMKELNDYDKWEDVPDEDLWQDGELGAKEVGEIIFQRVVNTGDWKLMRRKDES